MAKTGNGSKKSITLASLIIILVGIGSSGLTNYVNNTNQTENTIKDVDDLKDDGCDPSGVNTIAIARMDVKVEGFQEDVVELKGQMEGLRTGQGVILQAIKGDSP